MATDSTQSADTEDGTPRPADVGVSFEPPDRPYYREDALRLVLPGGSASAARLTDPVTERLVRAILETVQRSHVETVELLVFPGRETLEHVLCTTPATLRSGGIDQRTLRRTGDDLNRPGFDTLESETETWLPDRVGRERVTLDLSPLGMTPVPTSRLAVPENGRLAPGVNLAYHPLVWMLRALDNASEPYVYQLVVGRQSGNYVVSVRLATYDPDHNFATDEGFYEHVTNGHDYDLAVSFGDLNATSNFQIPPNGYLEPVKRSHDPPRIKYADRVIDDRTRRDKRDADAVRELIAGKVEHKRLLQGSAGYDDYYTEVGVYPRITALESQVGLFAALVPDAHSSNPWTTAPFRNPPVVTTQTILDTADGTPQGSGIGTTDGVTTDPAVRNEGGYSHIELGKFTARWFRELGTDVQTVEQTTDSLPDLRIETDDGRIDALDVAVDDCTPWDVDTDVVAVEIEDSNHSKAANTAANAARAAMRDRLVVFVYPSEQKARLGIEHLRTPFKESADHGLDPEEIPTGATDRDATWLYNWTEPVRLPDGSIPVLPPESSESSWLLSPDGRLCLAADGRTLATGDAAAGTGTFAYETPKYRTVDGTHRVERDDGTRLDSYDNKNALTSDYTLVRVPHVPLELSYLERSLVMYQDGEDLVVVDPDPRWDVDGNMERYRGAIGEALGTYTAHDDGAELAKPEFRERVLAWYDRQTDRKAPANHVFGRATPVDDDQMKSRKNNQLDLFRDRTWIVPPELESPDLPSAASAEETSDDTSIADGR